MSDLISRQEALKAVSWDTEAYMAINMLPSVQPEYEPVTAEDFAKAMSENSLYNFVAWHQEALTLMKERGFVICKKTIL